MLSAYVQAGPPDSITVWIGLFGLVDPTPPTLELDGAAVAHQVLDALRPIRDAVASDQGKPLDHRTVLRVSGLEPGTPYALTVVHGDERYTLSTATLPDAIPQKLDGAFNVLLCSCYSQPEDASGLLGAIVSQIKVKPHLTLMLGDQIYGDLPVDEDLPADDAGVARKLGAKYFRNWASGQLQCGGLESVLTRAPALCVADDHEYWNNYPFKQAQLPKTWTSEGREQWARIARELYEDYELAGSAGGTQRLDIHPLSLLVVDMRSLRDADFGMLVPPETLAEMRRWADDLIDSKKAGRPTFGVLASGQALFSAPASESDRVKIDAELGNYAQFGDHIMPIFESLAAEEIPVVYITGDVHWGRVARRVVQTTQRPLLYEVIASPSRMIRTPFVDAAREAKARIGGLFGRSGQWPRHSEPPAVPDPWGGNRNYRIEYDPQYGKRGDHIAIISFARAGGGVDFSVTYYGVSEDKALARSLTTPTYELRPT